MIGIDWSKVDWDGAPEGAMCYVAGWGFFRCEHGEWWVSQGKSWQKTPYKSPENFSWFGSIIDRPVKWSGEGLPPVGVECECNVSRSNWCPSKVFAHSPCGRFAAFLDSCGMNWAGAESFRPIRTQAQIEADEREGAIQQIMRDINRGHGVASRVYDQGYRKQPTKQDGE